VDLRSFEAVDLANKKEGVVGEKRNKKRRERRGEGGDSYILPEPKKFALKGKPRSAGGREGRGDNAMFKVSKT